MATVTNALNHTWTYAYSGPDLVSVIDPLSRTTEIFTDAVGPVVAVKDLMRHVSPAEFEGRFSTSAPK